MNCVYLLFRGSSNSLEEAEKLKKKKVNGWIKFKAYFTLWRPPGSDWWKAKPLGPMRTRLLFSDLQLICFSAQALANLIAASKIEDSLGVVQSKKSIPKALNAFIGCLNNMEDVRTSCRLLLTRK